MTNDAITASNSDTVHDQVENALPLNDTNSNRIDTSSQHHHLDHHQQQQQQQQSDLCCLTKDLSSNAFLLLSDRTIHACRETTSRLQSTQQSLIQQNMTIGMMRNRLLKIDCLIDAGVIVDDALTRVNTLKKRLNDATKSHSYLSKNSS